MPSPIELRPPAGPQRVDPLTDWPLHNSAASRSVEQAALARHAPGVLMERAGLGVARLALAIAPHAQRVDVLAGPGNNGGDGLVAARHLHGGGKAVSVYLLADPARLPADAAQALLQARQAGVPIEPGLPDALAGDLVIDALLGLGARRAPDGAIAEAIARSAAHSAPVLSVDLPSGLNPDTGQPLGAVVVRASATLSLLTLKPGLFTGAGRDLAGAVWFDSLGEAAAAPTARLAGAADVQRLLRPRRHASHKGSYGDVAVVGGAPGMTGAARLAARAALAAGAGRVYVSLLDSTADPCDPLRPELMGRAAWWRSAPEQLARTTVVCGCGGGDAIASVLAPLLQHVGQLVLDADALNAVAADAALQSLLSSRGRLGLRTVLTPHPLEAARLLGGSCGQVQQDRLAAAQALAARYHAVVVLKGSGSVTAEPGALPAVNATGNALLASPGTGDVLAGWMGGLWSAAPGLAGSALAAPGTAGAAAVARAAVWMHGRAADLAAALPPALSLRAADLVEALRDAAVD